MARQKLQELIDENTIKELLANVTLPPPIYGYHFTILPERSERQIKLVKSIHKNDGEFIVESLEGGKYIIPQYQVKFYRYE